MKNLQELMNQISEWSDAQFGEGDRSRAIAYHLRKEVQELIDAMVEYRYHEERQNFAIIKEENLTGKVNIEFADCFMLLLDSASHFGLTADDLVKVTEWKLEKNKNRKWGKPDENGVVEHIRESASSNSEKKY